MTHPTRVAKYQCTVYHDSTGSSHTGTYSFTQDQAQEVGGVLTPDGLDIRLAGRLCERWTRQGRHQGIRYTYSIPVL